MSLKRTCPGSHGVPFTPTFVYNTSAIHPHWQWDSFRHISSQQEYIDYSPEELRWEDYCQKEDLLADANGPSHDPVTVKDDKSQLPWEDSCQNENLQDDDNRSLHEPFTLDDDEAPKKPVVRLPPVKPVVCLPPATAGESSPMAVIKLQDELGELKLRVSKLEQALGGEKISNEKLKQEINGMKTLKWLEEMTKTASEKRVTEAREMGRAEALKEISEAEVKKLMETNHIARDMLTRDLERQLEIERGGIEAKFEAELPGRIEIRLRDLSEDDTRQLIVSNPTVKAIIAGNIKSKVEKELKNIKEQLSAEYDEKLKTVQTKADMAKNQVVLLEEKSTSTVKTDRQRLRVAEGMLGIVKKAASNDPAADVGDAWEEVTQFKLTAIRQLGLNTTTTADQTQISTPQPSMTQSLVNKDPEISGFDTSGGQQMPTPKGFSGYAFSSTWKGLPSNESNDQTPWSQERIEGMDTTLRQRSQDQECAEPVELGKRPRDSEAGVIGGEEKRRKLL